MTKSVLIVVSKTLLHYQLLGHLLLSQLQLHMLANTKGYCTIDCMYHIEQYPGAFVMKVFKLGFISCKIPSNVSTYPDGPLLVKHSY